MSYVVWLVIVSVPFLILERLRPRYSDQGTLRPRVWQDVFYLVFNGHYLSILLALGADPLAAAADDILGVDGTGYAGAWPFAARFLVALLITDFMQWCIHRLLHAVPPLWRVHQIHHALPQLDWAASMHFHWGEVIVYKTLQYVPLALLGFGSDALFVVAVFGTAIGHFNHSNLRIDIGPLRYVLNNPRMHIWHHAAQPPDGQVKNFGIVLSVWDWLFGTAYDPAPHPESLGYPGVERAPKTLIGQLLHPLPVERWWGRGRPDTDAEAEADAGDDDSRPAR